MTRLRALASVGDFRPFSVILYSLNFLPLTRIGGVANSLNEANAPALKQIRTYVLVIEIINPRLPK